MHTYINTHTIRWILFWDCQPGGGLCSKMADGASFMKTQTSYRDTSSDMCFEEENGITKFKADANLFDCYAMSCWRDKDGFGPGSRTEKCYVPAPRVCSYAFPPSEVRITIIAPTVGGDTPETPAFEGILKQLEATFRFSNNTAPAVMDGDCRLKAEGADNLLTSQSGDIAFDAIKWTARENVAVPIAMGWALKPTRVRWVIRPSKPTKSITLSFKTMDLSSRYLVDLLYVLPDCDSIAPSQYAEDILTDSSLKARVLNGNELVRYAKGTIPCPVTIHSSCIILELDMTRRFVYTSDSRQALETQNIVLEEKEDYAVGFKGFTASYVSSSVAEGGQSEWAAGGATADCEPEFSKVPPPAPKFEWNELCCIQEDGNQVFGGNFWGNLSINAGVPPGSADIEDYKIIYRVEEYNPAGALQLKEDFMCDQADFQSVEGWYPTERTERDKDLFYKSRWLATQIDEYPGNVTADTQDGRISGKLWFEKEKFVRIHGYQQIVQPSFILLNAPKPASDRPVISPVMYSHVMISAVVCKASKVGDYVFWIKSEVAVTDQIFTLGPGLSLNISLQLQPAQLVNFKQGATVKEQLALSQPLIAGLSSQIARLLGIPKRRLGVLKQIDAVYISVSKPIDARRAGYKTSVVLKPGYEMDKPQGTPAPPQAGNNADTSLYNVNITVSILTRTIKEAAFFSTKLTSSRRQLTTGSFQVQVQVPQTTQVAEGGPCRSHYDCTKTDLFCSSRKTCESCRFCSIDKVDSIDGICPKALCPTSGGFPECVDGETLVREVQTCQSSYPFSVWRHNTSYPPAKPEVQPEVKPRPKYITPHNRLVGALMVTQRRTKQVNCSVENLQVQTYLETSGSMCLSEQETDQAPFSLDPTFQRFSDVYNGKLDVGSVYFFDERADDKGRSPIAFFPHQHDPLRSKGASPTRQLPFQRKLTISDPRVTGHIKEDRLTHEPSRNTFKLYFDELPTGKQADRMLSFLKGDVCFQACVMFCVHLL
jgi:hypothetical protein